MCLCFSDQEGGVYEVSLSGNANLTDNRGLIERCWKDKEMVREKESNAFQRYKIARTNLKKETAPTWAKMKNLTANPTLKRSTHWALFSVIALMLIGSGTWAVGDSHADSANSECGLTDQQQEMLTLVNEARNNARQCGDRSFPAVNPLTWSCQLEAAAAMHASDMANNDYVSHTDANGAGIEQRANQHGYTWQALGENIAAGHTSVAAVVNGWLESPGHCRNMMNGTFTEMGMAKASNADSRYTTFWTQMLGKPR